MKKKSLRNKHYVYDPTCNGGERCNTFAEFERYIKDTFGWAEWMNKEQRESFYDELLITYTDWNISIWYQDYAIRKHDKEKLREFIEEQLRISSGLIE